MALSKIIAEGVDLTDDFAFTGTVTGAGDVLDATTTVPSEGGAATTNLVNGLAKWWVNADGFAAAVQGSFNNSSFADDANGSSYSYINNMNDAVYSVPHGGHYDDTNRASMYFPCFNNLTTSGVKCNTGTYSNTNLASDIDLIYASVFGDLA